MATKKKSKAKPKSQSKSKAKSKDRVKSKAKAKAAKPKPRAAARTSASARGRASARRGGSARAARRSGRADMEFPSKPRKKVDADTESSGDRRSSLGRATRGAQVDDEGNANRNVLQDNYYEPRGTGSESGGQSGDDEGLSIEEDADSESVDELAEEGQDYEAGIVAGVERAGTNLEQEVPVDDRADGGVPFGTEPPEETPEGPRRRRGRGRGAA